MRLRLLLVLLPLLFGAAASPASAFRPEQTLTQQWEQTVYITRTGKKYHLSGCRYLSRSKIPIALKEAVLYYGPCSVCRPPAR